MTAPPRAVLTDIEGTTSSIAFVKECCSPMRERIRCRSFGIASGGRVAALLDEVRGIETIHNPTRVPNAH